MNNLLIPLMKEYQRLMEIDAKYKKWAKENPELMPWDYKGQQVSRARFERIGIMIRQTMIDFERGAKR